jgi:hypothetical protein
MFEDFNPSISQQRLGFFYAARQLWPMAGTNVTAVDIDEVIEAANKIEAFVTAGQETASVTNDNVVTLVSTETGDTEEVE